MILSVKSDGIFGKVGVWVDFGKVREKVESLISGIYGGAVGK